jgi:FixJ family two-component response regulator
MVCFVLESIRRHIGLCMTPVIILTGAPDFDRESALRAGATYYFSKPVKNEILLQAIKSALSEF